PRLAGLARQLPPCRPRRRAGAAAGGRAQVQGRMNMGSAFDSEVYAERQRLPGVSINLVRLMQTMLWSSGEDGKDIRPIRLHLEYRPDVETSQWWTIAWGGDFVSATTLELCLFRAAVMLRRDDERAQKYAGMSDPEAAGG